jgi:hypothetical protein
MLVLHCMRTCVLIRKVYFSVLIYEFSILIRSFLIWTSENLYKDKVKIEVGIRWTGCGRPPLSAIYALSVVRSIVGQSTGVEGFNVGITSPTMNLRCSYTLLP